MNSVSPRRIPPSVEEVLAFLGLRDSFLVNKSQDGGQRGVGEAAWPSRGFDGSILVLLGVDEEGTIGRCHGGKETNELRTAPVAMHRGAARHYRAPKHTSCIIPPMLLCFLRPDLQNLLLSFDRISSPFSRLSWLSNIRNLLFSFFLLLLLFLLGLSRLIPRTRSSISFQYSLSHFLLLFFFFYRKVWLWLIF